VLLLAVAAVAVAVAVISGAGKSFQLSATTRQPVVFMAAAIVAAVAIII